MVVAQVLQQVLPVLAFAQVIFAQDDVEIDLAQFAYGHACSHGKIDGRNATHGQHVAQLRAHGGIRFDNHHRDIADCLRHGRAVGCPLG